MMVSKKKQSTLRRALTLASQSKCRAKHGAIVVKSGHRVIGVGVNSMRNEPKVVDSIESTNFWDSRDSIRMSLVSEHAEVAAIRQALSNGSDLKGATIYVARFLGGLPAMSKPCVNCQKLIDSVGIKKVIYTTDCYAEI